MTEKEAVWLRTGGQAGRRAGAWKLDREELAQKSGELTPGIQIRD